MYSPNHYKTTDLKFIYDLLRAESFATLLTGNAATVSHLPFVLEMDAAGTPRLLGHMARANPQWRDFSSSPEVKVLFQGPHGYISPAWYGPDVGNVPTWNYVAVV